MNSGDKENKKIRELSPDVSGTFYPDEKAHLKRTIDTLLREVQFEQSEETKSDGILRALMVPHAGYVYSGPIAAIGYRLVRELDQEKSWRVIIIGLSHFVPFSGISVGCYDQYSTPLGPINVSPVAMELIESGASFIHESHEKEHSIEVQLPFLKSTLKHLEIIPILTSNTDHIFLADILQPHINDSTLLIVSSDLSHMLPYNRAKGVDGKLLDWIVKGDQKNVSKRGFACGIKGILSMIELSERLGWSREMFGYATSGDTYGDKTQVVGYGCVGCLE